MLFALLLACAPTRHPMEPSPLGAPGTSAPSASASASWASLLDQPGPVTVETVASADWQVPLRGLLDLKDPRAIEAGLTDHMEPIHVYFHALRHPTHGLFLVDTGIEDAFRDDPAHTAIQSPLVRSAMHMELLKVNQPLGAWLNGQAVAAVFLTHLHLDHISGMADVPAGTPVYVGPGETTAREGMNALLRADFDRSLADKGPLRTWAVTPDPSGRFAGVVDVFGDGSVWGLWVPGHTVGSMAFVARTPDGPVLLTGDCSHTRWGWEHDVPPGTFTADHDTNVESLHALRALAAEHPTMSVRLGHQD